MGRKESDLGDSIGRKGWDAFQKQNTNSKQKKENAIMKIPKRASGMLAFTIIYYHLLLIYYPLIFRGSIAL